MPDEGEQFLKENYQWLHKVWGLNPDVKRHIKKWRIKQIYYESRKAQQKLRHAVKLGKIKKPDRCSCCHLLYPLSQILGHHEDYSKPFDVIWFCSKCHLNLDHSHIFPEKWMIDYSKI